MKTLLLILIAIIFVGCITSNQTNKSENNFDVYLCDENADSLNNTCTPIK